MPFLREAYADDISPVSKATLDCLKNCEKIFSETYETVTQLMPNAPLRTHKDIIDHKDEFEAFQRESQISCFKFGWFNPWWAFSGSSDTKYEFIHKEKIKCRSQDLPTLFCPSGAIWMSKCDHLKKHHSFYSSSTKYKELEIMSAVDIDDLEDLDMASILFVQNSEQRNVSTARNNTILFRVDASRNIGAGHVVRCLTLAVELRSRGFRPIFVCKAHEENLIDHILQLGFACHALPCSILKTSNFSADSFSSWLGSTFGEDAALTLEIWRSINPIAMVVDHYSLDADWERYFNKDESVLVVLDDLANRAHCCDILIDQNLVDNFAIRYKKFSQPKV